MSIHSSLKSSNTMRRHRSVLSRLERIKLLHEKGSLSLEESSFLGLPKVRHLKIRVRKEKAAAPAAAGAGTVEAGAAAPAGAPAGKAAAKAAPAGKAAAAAKASGGAAKPEAGGPAKKKE